MPDQRDPTIEGFKPCPDRRLLAPGSSPALQGRPNCEPRTERRPRTVARCQGTRRDANGELLSDWLTQQVTSYLSCHPGERGRLASLGLTPGAIATLDEASLNRECVRWQLLMLGYRQAGDSRADSESLASTVFPVTSGIPSSAQAFAECDREKQLLSANRFIQPGFQTVRGERGEWLSVPVVPSSNAAIAQMERSPRLPILWDASRHNFLSVVIDDLDRDWIVQLGYRNGNPREPTTQRVTLVNGVNFVPAFLWNLLKQQDPAVRQAIATREIVEFLPCQGGSGQFADYPLARQREFVQLTNNSKQLEGWMRAVPALVELVRQRLTELRSATAVSGGGLW